MHKDDNVHDCQEKQEMRTIEELLESFKPEEDDIDRKLLFFLTGRERDDCMMHWLENENYNENDSLTESVSDYEA